jgi:hypothetical protein
MCKLKKRKNQSALPPSNVAKKMQRSQMRYLHGVTIKWALSKETRMLVALRGMHGVGLVASDLWRFPTARLHEYPACNSFCNAAGTGVMTVEPTMFGRCEREMPLGGGTLTASAGVRCQRRALAWGASWRWCTNAAPAQYRFPAWERARAFSSHALDSAAAQVCACRRTVALRQKRRECSWHCEACMAWDWWRAICGDFPLHACTNIQRAFLFAMQRVPA